VPKNWKKFTAEKKTLIFFDQKLQSIKEVQAAGQHFKHEISIFEGHFSLLDPDPYPLT
jgi:hypothetical protein